MSNLNKDIKIDFKDRSKNIIMKMEMLEQVIGQLYKIFFQQFNEDYSF